MFDQYNDARKVLNVNGDEDWWWLRSPGGRGGIQRAALIISVRYGCAAMMRTG